MTHKPDKYQQVAIHTEESRVLVVAAPGSGKTTVIVNRVYYLMKQKNVSADNIIVITFTRAAAENMKERFKKLWGNGKLPFFGTFHGLFYKILRRHLGDISIINPSLAFTIINNTLLNFIDEVGEDKVKEVINNISLMKCKGIALEDFTPSIDRAAFINCYNNYEEYKSKKGLWDFDDIQIEAKKLFMSNEQLLDKYRQLFRYILVDEFQDCDFLQIDLLKLLLKDNNLFAVGDEDQSIYAFRGSNPKCMVEFQKNFHKGVKYFLNYNYRSVSNIVEGSIRLIGHNKERYEKDIKAFRKELGQISVNYVYNENIQGESIAQEIIKYCEGGGEFSHNAVLYRTNQEARAIIDAFIRRKIPFVLLDKEYNFYEHFICKDLLAYLKLSIDPYDRESLVRIINKPFRYISRANLQELKSYPYVMDSFEILKSLKNMPPFQIKNIDKLRTDISALNKTSLNSAINRIIMELGYLDYLKEYSSKYKYPFEDLEELLEEFKATAEDCKSIVSLLAHVEEYKEEINNSKKNSRESSVILSTIHGVKGMEFKRVFIIDCNQEYIPHKNSMKSNLEEERRLFYVGITRAIDDLHLYVPKSIHGKAKEVSSFIKEGAFKAAEKLPSPFEVGDLISHKAFNIGEVTELQGNIIEISFRDGIKRRFDLEILIKHKLLEKIG